MNAQAQALAAYRTPTNAQKTPRSIEYDLFAQTTARMRAALAGGRTKFPDLVSAMNDNRRLWSELAYDLALPGNKLPEQLRAQLLGLAQFTLNQTDAVLKNTANADVLIDLNIAIMRGLKGQGEAP
ncbi:MAG: flagellar biosynthesis regulator FlaF [Rhodobacteraceae bacterium]|nr:flagellar biosynthesis regulator FlaF [Paracoccaceae bacterium]